MPVLETNFKSVVGVPTGVLLGRSTAGIGPAEALSIDASLALATGKLSLNLANANTWTVLQNFGAGVSLSGDTILTRKAAATLQLGAADAAAPVAQTLSAQSVVAGTNNSPGQNWTFNAPQGTGTGGGGHFIFQTAPAGSAGSAQNALKPVLTLDDTLTATFAGVVNVASSLSQAANTSADGLVLNDTTPATLNNQQFSPRLRLSGQAWNTTVGASQQVDWIVENQTAQSTVAVGFLNFKAQSNGGGYTSVLQLDSRNNVTIGGSLTLGGSVSLPSGFNLLFGTSVIRGVSGGTIILGGGDTAAPVAQTLSVQSVVAGTSNTTGQNWTINGSRGTGTGAGGDIIFQTAKAGLTGTAQNALTQVLSIGSRGNVVIGVAALATTATDGFLYIPTCPGVPTGTPTAKTGTVPLVYDTTDNKLYIFSGSSWKAAAFA